MNKKILTLAFSCMSLAAFAQTNEGGSIEEIINMQQTVTETNLTDKHFEQVWDRKSFLNIAYSSSSLDPKGTVFPKNSGRSELNYVPTGETSVYDNGRAVKYSTDWGVSLMYGRNYSLLKKPIANIVLINLDYLPLDLNANHYKAEKANNLYNSDFTYELTGKDNTSNTYVYVPWNYEKYEFNYGMSLGPSVTVAPFTFTNINQLHFVKVNLYYHIGYHASLLLFKNAKNGDMGTGEHKSAVEKSSKLEIGHGLIQSFGFNISWKSIGIGYEARPSNLRYLSIDKSNFGGTQYKFKGLESRVYLQIRL